MPELNPQEQANAVLENLGLATNVLDTTDHPVVRITVEGQVGSGKTAIVALIQDLLKDKVKVVIEDDYTRRELQVHDGCSREAELKMYAPVVVLRETLTSQRRSIAA